MSKSHRLIFFGNERLSSGFVPDGAPTLEALIRHGYDIAAVVANYEVGQSRKARALEIESVARHYDIPVLLPDRPADIIEQLKELQADAAVLVAYGRIIPQSVIDIFPHGILNIHPSLLPRYRGPTPIERAILDGATQTGVSVMKLVREMDAGPIFAQARIDLNGQESKQELTQRLLVRGGELILDVLPTLLSGTAHPQIQDEDHATYTSLIDKSASSHIDLSKSAVQIEREIRAYASWPKSRLELYSHQVIVTKARVAQREDDGVLIVAANPGYLEILELVAPSGKKMLGGDFLRGYVRP
jgi:methionyl-tRNA formyltransferase